MLFFHALLLFILSTSVVAIPTSEQPSSLKKKPSRLFNRKRPDSPPGNPNPVASESKESVDTEKRIDGIWIYKPAEKGGSKYHSLFHGYILEIAQKQIVRIYPPLKQKRELLSMMASTQWSRITQKNAKGVDVPADMVVPKSQSFSSDVLLTSGVLPNEEGALLHLLTKGENLLTHEARVTFSSNVVQEWKKSAGR